MDKGQWLTLTFDILKGSCTNLVDYIYQLWYHWLSFWKIHCFTFFPYKSIRDKICPCRKIGQGQPRVIIWINLVVLMHSMLHTKFQGHWPFGSGKEDYLKVFTIYGHGGYLGHVTWTIWTNFCSPVPRRRHMKFGFNLPSGFRGEDVWKCWQHTNTYEGTTEACLYCKFASEPKGSGELITCVPSEDSDQSGHPPSLISVFTVRMKKP